MQIAPLRALRTCFWPQRWWQQKGDREVSTEFVCYVYDVFEELGADCGALEGEGVIGAGVSISAGDKQRDVGGMTTDHSAVTGEVGGCMARAWEVLLLNMRA